MERTKELISVSLEYMSKWLEELVTSPPIDIIRVLILFLTLIILYRKLLQVLNESTRNHLLNK